MNIYELRIKVLEEELGKAQDMIHMLKDDLGFKIQAPLSFALTHSEAAIFGCFMQREAASKNQLMTVLYALRPQDDPPEEKIIDVFVCKLRKKVAPFDIAIETIYGAGYRMTPASKAIAQAVMDMEAGRVPVGGVTT